MLCYPLSSLQGQHPPYDFTNEYWTLQKESLVWDSTAVSEGPHYDENFVCAKGTKHIALWKAVCLENKGLQVTVCSCFEKDSKFIILGGIRVADPETEKGPDLKLLCPAVFLNNECTHKRQGVIILQIQHYADAWGIHCFVPLRKMPGVVDNSSLGQLFLDHKNMGRGLWKGYLALAARREGTIWALFFSSGLSQGCCPIFSKTQAYV